MPEKRAKAKLNLTCCGREFGNNGALMKHRYAVHGVPRPSNNPQIQRRKAYTLRFKAAALAMLFTSLAIICGWCADFRPAPRENEVLPPNRFRCECGSTDASQRFQRECDVAYQLGIHPSMLNKWKKKTDTFHKLLEDTPRLKRLSHPRPAFPECEDILFEEFIYRRRRLGLAIDGYWLKSNFLDILSEKKPKGWATFKVSNGWMYGFLLRYDISYQCRNDKKEQSVMDRLPTIAQFHRSIWSLQGEMSLWTGVNDPEYGAFRPSNIWNVDQCPLPFALNMRRSFNPKGERCWIAVPGKGGLDKRQATLQICIRAGGPQVMKLFIIFKGSANMVPTQWELDQYAQLKHIKWAFQKNAWCDGFFAKAWMKCFAKCLRTEAGGGKHMLILDELRTQKTSAFKTECLENGILPVFVPAHCTDACQPIDLGIGKILKDVISAFYKIQLEVEIDEWRDFSGDALSAPKRRVMMAKWADMAWGLMIDKYQPVINGSFRRAGALVKRDKSNSAKIEVCPRYNAFNVPSYIN